MPNNSTLNEQLIAAALAGDNAAVQELVQQDGVDVNAVNEKGLTPLLIATLKGHTEVAASLLACEDLDPNVSVAGWTAPLLAVNLGNTKLSTLLIADKRIDVKAKNPDGNTMLHLELAKDHPNDDVVDRLLRHPDFDINATNNQGGTVLMVAAIKGHSLLANKIKIQAGTEINAVDENGYTALAYAVIHKQVIVINYLLHETPNQKNKIDLDIQEKSGNTPLMLAAVFGDADTILKLLNAGANPNLRNKEEKTAKEIAIKNGNTTAAEIFSLHETIKEKGLTQVIEYLVANENYEPLKILTQGINYNLIIEETGQTELIFAVVNKQVKWVKAFIALGADVNIKDVNQCDALMHAVGNGDFDIAKLLVENGADLSATNAGGCTALMMAAGFGHKDLLKILLAKATPEQINKTDNANYTASMHAIENNSQAEIIDSLVEKGANLNNEKLMLAACKGTPDDIEALLADGADINSQNDGGWTPLMSAIKYQNKDAAICLIENGADITLTTVEGHNALMFASFEGSIELMTLLLKDATLEYINAIDNEGLTARDHAINQGHDFIASQLDEKVATLSNELFQTTAPNLNDEYLVEGLIAPQVDELDHSGTTEESGFVAAEIIAPTHNWE